MRRLGLVLAAGFGLCASVHAGGLSTPQNLMSTQIVADYASVLKLCDKGGVAEVAIRTMVLSGEPSWLLVDPVSLATRVERATGWSCEDTTDAALARTRFLRAVSDAAEPPELTHRGFLANAGLKHGTAGGAYFTGDLCPSRKPLERAFISSLEGERTPVALSISGLWLKHHFEDYRWLTQEAARGALDITWVNHSYTHAYKKGVAEDENFMLSPGVVPDYEIEETEKLLIANGATPSVFFRFPGLVSSSDLMQAVAAHHLVSLGADAWLALAQAPHDGSIILVHPNGNEPKGVKIYVEDAAAGRLPTPLKPLDEAPR